MSADRPRRTFQASYIITLVLGLGVGEMLFGRYAAAAAMH